MTVPEKTPIKNRSGILKYFFTADVAKDEWLPAPLFEKQKNDPKNGEDPPRNDAKVSYTATDFFSIFESNWVGRKDSKNVDNFGLNRKERKFLSPLGFLHFNQL